MLFEDRTRAHADHIGQGFERQTTAAVGVLKAVHCGEWYMLTAATYWLLNFFLGSFSVILLNVGGKVSVSCIWILFLCNCTKDFHLIESRFYLLALTEIVWFSTWLELKTVVLHIVMENPRFTWCLLSVHLQMFS